MGVVVGVLPCAGVGGVVGVGGIVGALFWAWGRLWAV